MDLGSKIKVGSVIFENSVPLRTWLIISIKMLLFPSSKSSSVVLAVEVAIELAAELVLDRERKFICLSCRLDINRL